MGLILLETSYLGRILVTMSHEQEIVEIANAKYARRIARARSMTGEERLLESMELFEESLERMKAGVRFRHPEFTEDEILAKVNEQLKMIRAAEKVTVMTP